MILVEIVSPDEVAEPLKLTANVNAPALDTAIAAFDDVNDCTAAEPKLGEYVTLRSEALPPLNPVASLSTAPLIADSIICEVVSPVKVPIGAAVIAAVFK